MSKKVTAIVLALSILFCFTACGNKADSNESDTRQNGAVASSEGIPSGEPEPEPDPKTMPEYHFTEAVQERGVLTVGVSGNSKTCYVIPDDPEKYGELVGTRAGNVPEGCTEVVYDGGVYIYKLSSAPTSETLVNFINEKLIPEIQACSDTGTCLVKDPSGNDVLGLERGVTPFRAFDSFGYRVSDSGAEYAYWIIDGEQFANERQLSGGGTKLLDVRYVYDGVLYDAITKVREEDQAISVTPFEEPNQEFEIVE